METRGSRMARLLLVVGIVCCYVFYFNSRMHGTAYRSIEGLPVSGRLMDLDTAESATTYLLNASSAPAPEQMLKRPSGGASSTSAATQSLESSSTQRVSTSAAPLATTVPTRQRTAGKPARSTTAVPLHTGPLIREVYQAGFRSEGVGLCPHSGALQLVVILITTATAHHERRRAIRLTWGKVALRHDVTLAFVVGVTSDAKEQRMIDGEQKTYGDLIQSRNKDSYRNLTLKTVAILEWLDTRCPRAKIVLKTDDDMFINTENLLRFAEVHRERKNTLFGRLAHRWKPIRNAKSKYYLSLDVYPSKYLPDFMTGPAYVLTGDLVKGLYQQSLKMPFIHLEDVLVTGIVGDKLKVKRVNAKEFVNERIFINTCRVQTIVSVHMVKAEEQFDMWRRMWDTEASCPHRYDPVGG